MKMKHLLVETEDTDGPPGLGLGHSGLEIGSDYQDGYEYYDYTDLQNKKKSKGI